MHARIHPLFFDGFLKWLDTLPATDPKNDLALYARSEIVLDKSGHLLRAGIVQSSGEPAFDLAVLETIDRAQPFGPPAMGIASADGNVYLHWTFYRDETCGCSVMGSRPILMR